MRLCVTLLLGLVCWAAPARAQTPPTAVDPLHTLVSADDYPAEAVAKQEEGTVDFRLTVSPEGKVTGCSIQSSSGSAALDSASCKIMVERARFHPARDEKGKAITGESSQQITWRFPYENEMAPRAGAAFMLWVNCTNGEAAKLALSELSADVVAARSLQACVALEGRVMQEMRADVQGMILLGLKQAREALKAEPGR